METFAEENFLSLLLVILTKAFTRENSDREFKIHVKSTMHFNTFITLTDISKGISIFSNQIEFEEVYLHS